MRLLKTVFHPELTIADISADSRYVLGVRHAARAIVLRGDKILLLYTAYYDDYSLPGGGIADGEDSIAGLIRELQEETGARGVRNIKPFARYDEYRPWYKPDADIIHMISHCFTCDIDEKLGQTAYESHEVSNGMVALWKNIHSAIEHNEAVIANSDKKGQSIDRETFLLHVIADELIS